MAADSGAGALIAPQDGLSYVRGSTEVPLSEATIGQFLLDTVARFPERPAVVFREQGIRWTWRAFAHEVDVLAAALIGLGIERGDRVGIWAPNRAEWLLTQFATARIGAVLVVDGGVKPRLNGGAMLSNFLKYAGALGPL
ncbi:hypothetical protein WS62_25040 [Burkholderia sp. ABCPW 14]|nr:hypothetical protein WS62_25040 [Burkholderia sp. ABCPW 14]